MGSVSTNEFKQGMKIIVDGQPYTIITNEFCKPGKGQSFNRVRIKHLMHGRTIEKTFKSGDKVDEADVVETKMRMLYKDADGVNFMDDVSFEQVSIPEDVVGDTMQWLMENSLYDIVIYNGTAVAVEPPTFMDMKITQTDPGDRGNTASGRVLKPAVVESGAKINIPIFVEEGELIRVDTRTAEYVSRVNN